MSIKTPDQRVRVFISSTIQELANERKAATDAISRLKLTPVLFELGARPHPPKDLYRAYLDQSHIFVGIYWSNYGWVAPDMTISGLEDEYRLAGAKPQLIYVKQPAPHREPRLTTLLGEIEKSGTACYRSFSTPAELAELLQNDLAILLSERFEAPIAAVQEPVAQPQSSLPIMRSSIVGRQKEIAELRTMLASPQIAHVTLTGTGGTGKTRLAIEVAHGLKNDFKNGVHYVPLVALTDATLIPGAIAHDFGLFDSGIRPIREVLLEYLTDKHTLLVLDNFEHVIEGGMLVAEINERCPRVKVIATSRMPLNVRAEHIYPVQPLESPTETAFVTLDEALHWDSVQLFVQRARQVNPKLVLDKENVDAICMICRKLDGLPLAVELAALRTKYFSPVALQKRMGKVLDMLSNGPKDLPQRQQALRSTIDWSYNLLDEDGKKFFTRVAVFSDGWTMEAAHAVVTSKGDFHNDVMIATEKLVDLGLLRVFSHYNEEDATVEPRFTMLQTVQEYASEVLDKSGDAALFKRSCALYFVELCEEAEPSFWTAIPDHWFNRLQRDHANLRTTVERLLELGLINEAWQIFGAVGHFWEARGWATEATKWIEAIGISVETAEKHLRDKTVEAKYVARVLDTVGSIYFSATEFEKAKVVLQKSLDLYRELGDKKRIAIAGVYMGFSMISAGDHNISEVYNDAIENAEASGFTFGAILAYTFLSEVYTRMNRMEEAHALIDKAETACEIGISNEKGWQLALTMMQKGNLALATGDIDTAEVAFKRSINAFTTCFKTIKGWAHLGLGQSYLLKNDFKNARKQFADVVVSGRETGEKGIVATGIIGLAGIFAIEGDHRKAARLVSGIDKHYYKSGSVNWSAQRLLYDRVTKEINSGGLTAEELAEETKAGKGLTMEQLIALAMNAGVGVEA